MEHLSELERFLLQQGDEGESQGQGQFTLAREMSLKKLAEFQLPFEHAWLLKLIQAAVAGGSGQPIKVELGGRQAQFYFQLPELTLDELEEAFFNPEYQGKKSLRHLVSALWAAGIRSRWSFQVLLPGSSTTLIWDGEKLFRRVSEQSFDCAFLAVHHSVSQGGVLSWIKTKAQGSRLNVEFAQTLARNCCLCPVPLSVDRQRMDSLLNCPTHGWGPETLPLWLGEVDLDAPSLAVPPGTFQKVAVHWPSVGFFNSTPLLSYWETPLALEAIPKVPRFEEAKGIFIWSTRVKLVTVGSGKSETKVWQVQYERPHLHWVSDGVIVQSERLHACRPTEGTVAIYLSAEGLATDLTGLGLVESEEKKERMRAGLVSVAEDLQPSNFSTLLRLCHRHQQRFHRKQAWSALGVAALGIPVFFGIPPVGALMFVGGACASVYRAFIIKASDRAYRGRLEDHQKALRALLEEA